MLPRISIVPKKEFAEKMLAILMDIYENVVLCNISRNYQKYIEESNIVFNKSLTKRGLHHEYNEQTKYLRVNSYQSSIQEYHEFKEQTINDSITFFVEYANNIRDICDIETFHVRLLWSIFSLNINIIPYKNKLTQADFTKEYPKYNVEKCTEEQWNKLKDIQFYKINTEDESLLIKHLRNLVIYGNYTPYNKNSRVKYNVLGMNFQNIERKVNSFIMKLSQDNYKEILEEIKEYFNDETREKILNSIITYLIDMNVIDESVYIQLVKTLGYKSSELRKFMTNPKILSLLYYHELTSKLEIYKRLKGEISLQLVLSLYAYRELSQQRYKNIETELKQRAEMLINKAANSREKFLLLDVIEG